MEQEKILKFLQKQFPNQEIIFIGSGSDSTAFKIGNHVIRVPHKKDNAALYLHEASICNAIKKYIDFDIPNITIHNDEILWIEHKMITGCKWSWHKFMFHPIKQRNLTISLARFMAQLHSKNVADAVKKAKHIKNYEFIYIPYKKVSPYIEKFLHKYQIDFFHKNYAKIIYKNVPDSDMVLCHLGIKGPNSVVDENGYISGVFDFCNAGIYERWRDMILIYLMAGSGLYRTFCREYKRITGIKVDTARIKDLAAVEFLWAKRWYHNDKLVPLNEIFLKKNIAGAMARFHRMPKFMKWWWYFIQ